MSNSFIPVPVSVVTFTRTAVAPTGQAGVPGMVACITLPLVLRVTLVQVFQWFQTTLEPTTSLVSNFTCIPPEQPAFCLETPIVILVLLVPALVTTTLGVKLKKFCETVFPPAVTDSLLVVPLISEDCAGNVTVKLPVVRLVAVPGDTVNPEMGKLMLFTLQVIGLEGQVLGIEKLMVMGLPKQVLDMVKLNACLVTLACLDKPALLVTFITFVLNVSHNSDKGTVAEKV